jgi:NAD(P) transhydrogenase
MTLSPTDPCDSPPRRREDHRLLGVHRIGTGATELVHVGQAVVGLGGGLDPTLAECYKVAALDASNRLRL